MYICTWFVHWNYISSHLILTRENACEFQEFHAIYFSKIGQLVNIRHKKLVEGRGGRGHTWHIYSAPRFVIYNTEEKAEYKIQIKRTGTRSTCTFKVNLPPPHSFFSAHITLIHLYIKTKLYVHNAPFYKTGKYCWFVLQFFGSRVKIAIIIRANY